MSERVRLKVYNVDRCGFYEWGASQPEFGDIDDAFDDLKSWVTDMPFGESCPFAPEGGADLRRLYCLSMHKSPDGDFLVSVWNEASEDGTMAAVPRSSTVGAPTFDVSDFGTDSIPGIPSYFWIIPSHRLLVTVGIRSGAASRSAFEHYAREFLAKSSSYVFEDDDGILGYGEDEEDDPRTLHPRFVTSPKRLEAHIATLRQRRPHIRAIIRKNKVRVNAPVERTFVRRMLVRAGISDPDIDAVDHEIPFRYRVRYTPNEDELEEMISGFTGESGWDNVCFEFDDGSTIWLKGMHVASEPALDLRFLPGGVAESNALLAELRKVRSRVLRSFR